MTTTSDTVGRLAGPSYCCVCGDWPAYRDNQLCHLCDCTAWCEAHQVPGGPADAGKADPGTTKEQE